MGLKLFLSGCSRLSRGWEVIFFLEARGSVYFGRIHGGPRPSSVSLFTIGGPLRSVSSHTMGSPQFSFFKAPQVSFFAYYMGAA